MKLLASVLLLACAALLVVAVALRARDGGVPAVAPGSTGAPPPPTPTAPGRLSAPGAADREAPRSAPSAEERQERRTVASEPDLEGPKRDVLVLDGVSGQPVADALVCVPVDLGEDPARRRESDRLRDADVVAYLARFSLRIHTDASGHAAIPMERETFVYGSAPGRIGRTYHRPDDPGTLRLALFPEQELRVVVLDDAGQPAEGVPVSLRESHRPGATGRVLATRPTDAKGELRLRNFGLLARQDGWHELASHLVVSLAIPTREPIEAEVGPELDPLHLPDAAAADPAVPVEPTRVALRLPPCGSVVVHVADESGAAVRSPASVNVVALDEAQIEPARAATTSGSGMLGGARWWEGPQAPAPRGDARFPYVPIGQTYGAVVFTGYTNDRNATVFEGPRVVGEEREVTVRPGPRTVQLVALLTDETGVPLADRDVEVGARSASGRMSLRAHTSAEGRISIRIPAVFGQHDLDAITLRAYAPGIHAWQGEGTGPERTYHEEWRAPRALAPGDNDLGTLALTPVPLLVGGRVVDRQGNPVAGVQVEHGTLTRRLRANGKGWYEAALENAHQKTDADGRFLFQGEPVAPYSGGNEEFDQALTVLDPGLAPFDPIPFRRGDEDVVLRVERGGWIEGTVLVSDLRVLRAVGISARDPETDEAANARWSWNGTAFRIDGLPAGTWNVVFRTNAEGRPFLVVEDVHVPRDGPADDARLQAVDLKAVALIHVHVRAKEGDLRVPLKVSRREAGSQGWSVSSSGTAWKPGDAHLDFVTAFPGFDLRIEGAGYLPAELHHVDGDREVLLERGLPVVVELEGDPLRLAGPEAFLRLHLQPRTQVGEQEQVEAPPDAREVTLHATVPGTYVLVADLMVRYPDGWSSARGLGTRGLEPIEVRDDAPTPRVHLELDPREIDDAYRWFRQIHQR